MITFENRYVKTLIELANTYVGRIEKDGWIDYQVQEFTAQAKANGYIKLGSGYFSQAWTHPEIKDYAIKLGFKKEDSGAAYAAYCRANQGKAGIPVIHGIERTRACYVVLMDKLISFEFVKNLHIDSMFKYDQPRVVREYWNLHKLFEWGLDSVDMNNLSELEKTAVGIFEHFKGIALFDIHEGNVMLDKFGRLVITDPVSFGKTCKKEAERGFFVADEFIYGFDMLMAWKFFNENFPAKVAANPNYKPSLTEKELSFADRFGAHG